MCQKVIKLKLGMFVKLPDILNISYFKCALGLLGIQLSNLLVPYQCYLLGSG